jgi:hypothetical protein
MKRKDIISKLMIEGFSEKTLVNLNDKQLGMLAKRILSEQVAPAPAGQGKPITKVAAQDVGTQQNLQAKGMPMQIYEKDIKEDIREPKAGEDPKKLSEKETIIKRANDKIKKAIEDGKGYQDYITAIKKVNGGKLPDSTEKLVVDKEYKKLPAKEKEAVSEVKKWVNKIVESKVHPFTSKKEIMELIQSKLTDENDTEVETLPGFLTGKSILGVGASEPTTKPITKPTTKPGTKPITKPTPKTPYQPGPGPKHNPKAGAKV